MTTTIKSPAGKSYRLRVIRVGTNFGCVCQVLAGSRVVHSTDTFPRGSEQAARERAATWIERQK
jgi:hypothetical protein